MITGSIIRIPGLGGNKGDLLVVIEAESHPYFKRDGADIHTNQLITVSQAILGATIQVPTIYGKTSIKIKPGTQAGSTVTIVNHGAQRVNQNTKGNHYVHINIRIPGYLNEKQKEAIKAYSAVEDKIEPDNPKI